jgi:hypothetical protein
MIVHRRMARYAVLALALACLPEALAAQVSVTVLPTAAEQAAGQRKLHRVEAQFIRRLRRSHGDPAIGTRLGDALRSIDDVRLPHASQELRAAVSAARDPVALALAIADGETSYYKEKGTLEVEILLAALQLSGSAPNRPLLWAKAWEIERADKALSLAFLEQAYGDSRAEDPGCGAAGESCCVLRLERFDGVIPRPNACMLAAALVRSLLDHGLAREAVATFDALPTALQERILASWVIPWTGRADWRLCLAAARLLEGDTGGGLALLARTSIAAWRPDDPAKTPGSGPGEDRPAAILRALLERFADKQAAGDPFPLFAELVPSNLFGQDQEVWGAPLTVFALLAEREAYPEFARFAWMLAGASANSKTDNPELLPAPVRQTAERLRSSLAEHFQRCRAAFVAADAAGRSRPRPAIACPVDCGRLDLDSDVQLFALDRSGQHGIVYRDHDLVWGEIFRMEMRDGKLVAERIDYYTS